MNINRFLLFGFEYWEAAGGWEDYKGAFTTLQLAKAKGDRLIEREGGGPANYHYHVVDLLKAEIVYDSPRPRFDEC